MSNIQPKKTPTSDGGSRLNWPWIYYADVSPTIITLNKRFKTSLTLSNLTITAASTYYLDYYIAVYDMLGNFEEFRLLGNEFMLCPKSTADSLN